jgi:hypothetical protein
MGKGCIHLEDITIINVYVPHSRAPESMMQTSIDLKWEADSSTIAVRNF